MTLMRFCHPIKHCLVDIHPYMYRYGMLSRIQDMDASLPPASSSALMSSDEPLAAQTQSDCSALPLRKTGDLITCLMVLSEYHLILAREIRR